MKHISIVAQGLSNGGAERVASILANSLNQRGYKVLFIAAYSNERVYKLDSEVKYVYIEKKGSKIGDYISTSKQIYDISKRFGADVIISFFFREMAYAATKSIPIIYTLRINPENAVERLSNRIICSFTYHKARRIVFQTHDALSYFDRAIMDKGVVIGNPLTRELPFWNETNHLKRVITACRLTKQKNIPMLLRGFSIFLATHPDYSLHICGDGPERESLIEYSTELGIRNRVVFEGYRKDVHTLMANSAIFTLTSDFEGLSNSMLEALAIGIPTICTDCPPGGAREYIEDGINGYLINTNDYEALANKLCLLADSIELCNLMSKNAIKLRTILSEEKVIAQWEEIIDQCISRRDE